MKALRELLLGLLTSFVSIILVIGAFFLAIAEGKSLPHSSPYPVLLFPSPIVKSSSTIQIQPTKTLPVAVLLSQTPSFPSVDYTATVVFTETPTIIVTTTSTPASPDNIPTTCAKPDGWQQYVIMTGDKLELLAENYRIDPEQLKTANCLISDSLIPGTIIYVPQFSGPQTPTKTISPSPTACLPPDGWGRYYVQSGDSLFKLSRDFGVGMDQLQAKNCLKSTTIIIGQLLYVPGGSLSTPVPTITPRPSPTSFASVTPPGLPTTQGGK